MRCAGGECRRTKGFVIVHQVVDWTGQDRTIESHVLGACPKRGTAVAAATYPTVSFLGADWGYQDFSLFSLFEILGHQDMETSRQHRDR